MYCREPSISAFLASVKSPAGYQTNIMVRKIAPYTEGDIFHAGIPDQQFIHKGRFFNDQCFF